MVLSNDSLQTPLLIHQQLSIMGVLVVMVSTIKYNNTFRDLNHAFFLISLIEVMRILSFKIDRIKGMTHQVVLIKETQPMKEI